MKNPLRLGIIGTGVAVQLLHRPALEELPERYEVRALANRTVSKAQELADQMGVPRDRVYADYEELLACDDIDVVLLALPPKLNYEVSEKALRADKHVICEKPIAASLEDARKMVELPSRYGKKLYIAENFRYEKAIQETKRLLDEGTISRPYMMLYKWMQHVPEDDEIATRPWRKDSGLPGGFLSDHGIHMIDVVRFLLGDIEELQVYGGELAAHVAGVDTALYNMKCRSGTLCSVQWSFAADSNDMSKIELWARDGSLRVSMDRIEIRTGGDTKVVELQGAKSSFYYEWLDFYDAITGSAQPLMTPEEGLADLIAIQKAYESIERHDIASM
jgi:predicted dehydrogenase